MESLQVVLHFCRERLEEFLYGIFAARKRKQKKVDNVPPQIKVVSKTETKNGGKKQEIKYATLPESTKP